MQQAPHKQFEESLKQANASRSPKLAPVSSHQTNDVRSLLYDESDFDEITSWTRNPFDLDTLVDELECDSAQCDQCDQGSDSSYARIFE